MKLLHASVDAGSLEDADQNRERAIALDLFQVDHLLVVDLANDDPRQLHLHGHGRSFAKSRLGVDGYTTTGIIKRGAFNNPARTRGLSLCAHTSDIFNKTIELILNHVPDDWIRDYIVPVNHDISECNDL